MTSLDPDEVGDQVGNGEMADSLSWLERIHDKNSYKCINTRTVVNIISYKHTYIHTQCICKHISLPR